MDPGPAPLKSTPKRWPRGQKFTLSAAGEAAELAHRDAVNGARSSGRAALLAALTAWAQPLAVPRRQVFLVHQFHPGQRPG